MHVGSTSNACLYYVFLLCTETASHNNERTVSVASSLGQGDDRSHEESRLHKTLSEKRQKGSVLPLLSNYLSYFYSKLHLLRRSGQCFRFISNFWRYINCQLQFNLQLAIPRKR